MDYLIIILCVLIFLILLFLFLVSPPGSEKRSWVLKEKKIYAHRGFFDKEASVPENSAAAFKRAIKSNYGIELDVHLTKDEKLVVIHDSDTFRVCGKHLHVESSTYEELSCLRLDGTDERILLFSEFLSLVNGSVPLIVEIKGEDTNTSVCEKTALMLDGYNGEYCIESFNPIYVGWWKKHRPKVIRGQLSCKMEKAKSLKLCFRNFALENMFLNFISRPDFVAYDINGSNRFFFRLSVLLGAVPVAWTVRSEKEYEKSKKLYSVFICEKGAL